MAPGYPIPGKAACTIRLVLMPEITSASRTWPGAFHGQGGTELANVLSHEIVRRCQLSLRGALEQPRSNGPFSEGDGACRLRELFHRAMNCAAALSCI